MLSEGFLGALNVSLNQLNLKQVIDVGYQLQALAPSLKILDIDLKANATDSRYLDVIFKLVSLKVPVLPPPEPEPVSANPKKGNAKPKKEDDL